MSSYCDCARCSNLHSSGWRFDGLSFIYTFTSLTLYRVNPRGPTATKAALLTLASFTCFISKLLSLYKLKIVTLYNPKVTQGSTATAKGVVSVATCTETCCCIIRFWENIQTSSNSLSWSEPAAVSPVGPREPENLTTTCRTK